jgi:hypothetical protein
MEDSMTDSERISEETNTPGLPKWVIWLVAAIVSVLFIVSFIVCFIIVVFAALIAVGNSLNDSFKEVQSGVDRANNLSGEGVGGHYIGIGDVNNHTHLESPGSGLLGWFDQQVEDRPLLHTEWTLSAPAWGDGALVP